MYFRCGGNASGGGKKVTKIELTSITRTSNSVAKIDLSQHYAGYANIDISNIVVELYGFLNPESNGNSGFKKTYDSNTGLLTLTGTMPLFSSTASVNKANIYIIE